MLPLVTANIFKVFSFIIYVYRNDWMRREASKYVINTNIIKPITFLTLNLNLMFTNLIPRHPQL